jgi:DNA-binding MarR family transcriptional regulator
MMNQRQCIQVNQALFSLAHAYEAMMLKDAKARASDVRLSDCAVIMVLGQLQPVSASQLSICMFINPGTISLYLRRLENKGLIVRERDKVNRRLWWLTLTEQGRDAYNAIIQGTVQYTRDFLSPLQPAEQEMVHRLLLKASHGLGFDWQ